MQILSRKGRLTYEDEIVLMNSLASMSVMQANRCRDKILDKVTLKMPLTFLCSKDYVEKLEEQLDKEAEAERILIETIGEGDIEYEFLERLEIYCKLRLRIPKTNLQHLCNNTVLRVVIPVERDPKNRYFSDYIGNGTIKHV